MIKSKERFISLKFDLMFKKVFGSEDDLIPIKKLLKEVLGIIPKDVKILNSELVGRPYKDRDVRVDLIVELEDGTKVNVEVNSEVTNRLIERNLYYLFRNITKDVMPKSILERINRHIQINLDYSGIHEKPIMSYSLYEKETHKRLTDMIEIIRIDIPYFKDRCYNKNVDELDSETKFLGLFGIDSKDEAKKLCKGDKDMEDIYKRIDKYNDDEDVIGAYDYKAVEEEIKQEQLEEAIQKGIDKGFNQGIEQGISKGIAKGIEQGISKGVEQGIETTAKNLLKENIDINIISKVTGLSLKEIEKLKQV